jgi:hypothetical protein
MILPRFAQTPPWRGFSTEPEPGLSHWGPDLYKRAYKLSAHGCPVNGRPDGQSSWSWSILALTEAMPLSSPIVRSTGTGFVVPVKSAADCICYQRVSLPPRKLDQHGRAVDQRNCIVRAIRDIGEGRRLRRLGQQAEPPLPAWRRGPPAALAWQRVQGHTGFLRGELQCKKLSRW